MTRAVLSLNLTEDQVIARVDAALRREREASPRKPKRQRPEGYIILNGQTYIPAKDLIRERAESALAATKRGSR